MAERTILMLLLPVLLDGSNIFHLGLTKSFNEWSHLLVGTPDLSTDWWSVFFPPPDFLDLFCPLLLYF
jgi:hypothetical protein